MGGRRSQGLFFCRDGRRRWCALPTLIVGVFLLASLPRVAGFLLPASTAGESRFVRPGDFLDGVITGRASKSSDVQTESRFLTGSVWNQVSRSANFVRAVDQSAVYPDPPAAGAFLIRSPPSVPTP